MGEGQPNQVETGDGLPRDEQGLITVPDWGPSTPHQQASSVEWQPLIDVPQKTEDDLTIAHTEQQLADMPHTPSIEQSTPEAEQELVNVTKSRQLVAAAAGANGNSYRLSYPGAVASGEMIRIMDETLSIPQPKKSLLAKLATHLPVEVVIKEHGSKIIGSGVKFLAIYRYHCVTVVNTLQ